MARVMNFNPGPATIPEAVLAEAREELLDFNGTGMSVMEHSHRRPAYEAVHDDAIALLRELLDIGDSHEVLLLQGGARQQFAMVPMNLLVGDASADYVLTGTWAEKAHAEAARLGRVRVAATTATDGRYRRVPRGSELDLDPHARYVHITTNNTVAGTQWHALPDTADVPLVADMCSDILSRPVDVSRFAVIYAGAQKNLGPAGVTVVIVRRDLLELAPGSVPEVFRYASHAAQRSLYNTPPTFAIYLLRGVLRWVKEQGGVPAMERRNQAKAELLYRHIDGHGGFYRSPVEAESRSLMNVVFNLPTPELEARFVAEAEAAGMVGLKGHRLVGGIRASIYNAAPEDWVARLVEFMTDFEARHRPART